jgi:hypothetical protein
MTGFSLTNVHLSCFVASYLVALLLELSRLFLRSPARLLGTLGFAAAGVFAQTIYIGLRTQPSASHAPPLSSWFDWLLLVAWGVAMAYLVLSCRRPQAAYGVFMLPLVLLLIAFASLFRDVEPFPRGQALYVWGIVHGVALMVGSVVVLLGFTAGMMYLVQSYRLKKKLPPLRSLKLPSLEWLQLANQRALRASSWVLAAGLLAGAVLNVLLGPNGLPWTDPVVWTSGLLLLWLVVVMIFEATYKPAQQGRKVAYLTLASCVVLALVLGMVLLAPSRHASPQSAAVAPFPPARQAFQPDPIRLGHTMLPCSTPVFAQLPAAPGGAS